MFYILSDCKELVVFSVWNGNIFLLTINMNGFLDCHYLRLLRSVKTLQWDKLQRNIFHLYLNKQQDNFDNTSTNMIDVSYRSTRLRVT